MTKRLWILAVGLALLSAVAVAQQEGTRVQIRKGKVVYVSPDVLIVRGQNGFRKFTRNDWKGVKVEKDGQMIDPDQLHKGDYVTATILTTSAPTTLTAAEEKQYAVEGVTSGDAGEMTSEKVIWTEIKRGKVVYVSKDVLLVRGSKGVNKFTSEDWKDTKVDKDGQMIDPDQLHKGDIVTATFVTHAMPSTISTTEVAKYEASSEAPPPAKPAPPVAHKPAPAVAPAPAAAPAAAAAPAEPAAPVHTAKKLPKTASSVPAIGLAGLALLGLAALSTAGRRMRASR